MRLIDLYFVVIHLGSGYPWTWIEYLYFIKVFDSALFVGCIDNQISNEWNMIDLLNEATEGFSPAQFHHVNPT